MNMSKFKIELTLKSKRVETIRMVNFFKQKLIVNFFAEANHMFINHKNSIKKSRFYLQQYKIHNKNGRNDDTLFVNYTILCSHLIYLIIYLASCPPLSLRSFDYFS